MPRPINKTQQERLLQEIAATEGYALSLMDLAFWTRIPYSSAWCHLQRLKQENKVIVSNKGYRRGGLKIGLRKPLPTEQLED